MTATVATHVSALSFGDVDGRIWGGAIDAGLPMAVFGAGGDTVTVSGADALEWIPDGQGWRLRGGGFDLHMEPEGDELTRDPAPDPGMTVSGVEELCRVTGRLTAGGDEHAVDCIGARWVLDGVDAAALGSLRAVAGWFAPDNALALISLRDRRGTGQESDLIAATLFDPEGWLPVRDPRLSTTYTQAGLPLRANLELWVGDEDNEFPRRAAAEAAGDGATVSAERRALRVAPLRCHSRGLEGAGVYVLATFD
ncbi:MAG: hypothetical protein ABSH51_00790 [Solirubrobacteraceae bacterium]|jgi:hypothetical protein